MPKITVRRMALALLLPPLVALGAAAWVAVDARGNATPADTSSGVECESQMHLEVLDSILFDVPSRRDDSFEVRDDAVRADAEGSEPVVQPDGGEPGPPLDGNDPDHGLQPLGAESPDPAPRGPGTGYIQ